MFHPLTLVEIENGGAENLFESFFEITFVDGHFAAERLDGNGIADMLQENLAGVDDFLAVFGMGKKF